MGFLFCAALLITQGGETLLPRWMTPEEHSRIHEIGSGHEITAPPEGWVETPGEFEEMRGVFITWQYSSYSSRPIFREIVREVAEICRVYIIVGSSSEQDSITNYLQINNIPLDSVNFFTWPRNSIWIRDYGPWFVYKQDNTEGIIDFIYNRPRPLDDTIPWRIGQSWAIPVYGSPLEHAGGNFMVDGLGTGFASTLIYQENPSMTPGQIESLMLAYNGLEQFIVLPRINTEYTGHIDLWTKILNDTLVMVGEYAPGHPNHNILNDNADSIGRCMNREGFSYRIARIPMPWSTSDAPPSYLNSLIMNNKVLVPLYNQVEDDTALFIYQQLMPDHEIIGINCAAMSGWGGAIHCITMQLPSSRYLCIQHHPLTDTADTLNDYRVRARIITSSDLIPDSTIVYYRINSGIYETIPLMAVIDTPGVYAGYIPAQSFGDTIAYYILTENNEGARRTSPNHVPPQLYSFIIAENTKVLEQPADELINTIVTSPNPAQNSVIFSLELNESAHVSIEVYNALGQIVNVIANRKLSAGHNEISWNLVDSRGRRCAQGVYFYRVFSTQTEKIGKILLIK